MEEEEEGRRWQGRFVGKRYCCPLFFFSWCCVCVCVCVCKSEEGLEPGTIFTGEECGEVKEGTERSSDRLRYTHTQIQTRTHF